MLLTLRFIALQDEDERSNDEIKSEHVNVDENDRKALPYINYLPRKKN